LRDLFNYKVNIFFIILRDFFAFYLLIQKYGGNFASQI